MDPKTSKPRTAEREPVVVINTTIGIRPVQYPSSKVSKATGREQASYSQVMLMPGINVFDAETWAPFDEHARKRKDLRITQWGAVGEADALAAIANSGDEKALRIVLRLEESGPNRAAVVTALEQQLQSAVTTSQAARSVQLAHTPKSAAGVS